MTSVEEADWNEVRGLDQLIPTDEVVEEPSEEDERD